MKRNQEGFTLIELIVVMVILGIIAAFAIPRFAGLSGEARASVQNGTLGAVRAAATLVRGKWLAGGSQGTIVTLENGTNITVNNAGLPVENTSGTANGICEAVEFSAGDVACANGVFTIGNVDTCTVTYDITATDGTGSAFTVVTSAANTCG